ncbi:metallophosphoesterase [Mucilaginibacter sp. Bleaf8]|uniref:BamA/TamA family outer membrane protein n=1 Tax=Mucilaginibacter sp. Bleaf8 TaxID=2834430 RepID=UPI001BCF1FC4|nr:BamA/TamA family outer membrane protein [Mucilaginibacter sp. Bleaf8]MBS7564953.1 metallophosphoesterase [Mucilaginibacter sp. Bleaf8]
MKKILLCLLLSFPLALLAQDSVVYRIVYIGDAGELDPQQSGVLTHAANNIISGKTSVVYLGDNIYPTGMGLPGSREEEGTKKILQSQYQPMRQKGAPVYFIPGNHDWDRMGPKGMAKVKRQWEYISEQKDSLLKVVPEDGCPGPYEISINKDLTIIAFDSEWWLYLFSKDNPNADCDCKTQDEVIDRLKELLYKNRNKVILLSDHHPFQSYGHHGGAYDILDYFFPLTSVKRSLYIPLPGLGALYPFLRANFATAEDQGHPLYRRMVQKIDAVFDGFPNVVHVSGHEHGLQFIKGRQMQVVSGSGAKQAFVKKGKNALYAASTGGYVTADLLTNKSIRFTYYASSDSVIRQVFTYTKPYDPVNIALQPAGTPVMQDSVVVKARPEFDQVSKIHRKLYGENYRKEWAAPVKLPVIRISEAKGGLTPVQLGGIHQTKSLILKDSQGKQWVLSSIEKYPEVILTQSQRETLAKSWLRDAMSAQHPYATLMAPVLANAVKVPHTNPVIGWVSPDGKLGYYEKIFAGKICILEEYNPGNRSVNTGNMLKQLDRDNDNLVDTAEFFKARLLDWFMGDWDQQADQWRWQNRSADGHKYYFAVPRNRDQAFYVNEGIIPKINSRMWVAPYLKGYASGADDVNFFYFSGRTLNSRYLAGLDHDNWMRLTQYVAASLTDSVLQAALRKLPAEAYRIRHQLLFKQMQQRRNQLMIASENYYRFFNRIVDIRATDKHELITIQDTLNGNLYVTIRKKVRNGAEKQVLFSRIYDPAITRELRVYAAKGDDSIVVNIKRSSVKLRLVGGAGNKTYNAQQIDKEINVYEKGSNASFIGKVQSGLDKHISKDSVNVGFIPTNLYNVRAPVLMAGYNPDDGVWLSAGIRFITQGFRKMPGNVQEFTVQHGFDNKANKLTYQGEWTDAIDKADIILQGKVSLPNVINFFGRGNNTGFNKVDDFKSYYRARFNLYEVNAALRWQNASGVTSVRIGPAFQYYHFLQDDKNRLIYNSNLIHSYDSATVVQDKAHAGLSVTYINDKRNNAVLPSWGIYFGVKLQAMAGLNQYSGTYVQVTPAVEFYRSVTTNSSFVIIDKLGGGITLGKAAYYQSLFLGGPDNLPGYRQYRFAGQQMVYNNLEARIRLNRMATYILPGQYGITAFHGIGRVWENKMSSSTWHNSVGGGMYFSPADLALLKVQAAYSHEGWYPFVSFTLSF